jgi:hypothetical protein
LQSPWSPPSLSEGSESLLAEIDNGLRCLLRLLLKEVQHRDHIAFRFHHDASLTIGGPVGDAKFKHSRANRGHRANVRHSELVAALQRAQQGASLNPRTLGHRRRRDDAGKPSERFVRRAHMVIISKPICAVHRLQPVTTSIPDSGTSER